MSGWIVPKRGPMISATALTEKEFQRETAHRWEFKRAPELDSQTTRAYVSEKRIITFDIHDGHMAWNFDRVRGKTEFRCNCIARGQAILGVTLE